MQTVLDSQNLDGVAVIVKPNGQETTPLLRARR